MIAVLTLVWLPSVMWVNKEVIWHCSLIKWIRIKIVFLWRILSPSYYPSYQTTIGQKILQLIPVHPLCFLLHFPPTKQAGRVKKWLLLACICKRFCCDTTYIVPFVISLLTMFIFLLQDPREKAKSETRDWLNNVVWNIAALFFSCVFADFSWNCDVMILLIFHLSFVSLLHGLIFMFIIYVLIIWI